MIAKPAFPVQSGCVYVVLETSLNTNPSSVE